MAVLALTQSNLEHTKRMLSKAHPEVKSSHLSEGIAAGLGCNTHAALKALLGESNLKRSRVVRTDGERLNERMWELGYLGRFAEELDAAAQSEQVPEPMWREFAWGDVDGQNNWFYECKRRNIPFIYVAVRRSLAELRWDYISLQSDLDARLKSTDEGRRLVDALFAAFQRQARSRKKSQFLGSALVGTVDNVPISDARMLADEYVLLLEAALAG